MVDFNDVELNVGDTIFFKHGPKQSIIGKITEIKGKKTIRVSLADIIKSGPRLCLMEGSSVMVNSDEVLKIQG